jgi:hypothetical protein
MLRTYLRSLGTQKLRLYFLLAGGLWIILTVLAENQGYREALEHFNQWLKDGVNGAQVAEFFLQGLSQPLPNLFDPGGAPIKPPHPVFLPLFALIYAARQVWTANWFSKLIGLVSLLLAFGVWHDERDRNFLGLMVGVPLGSAFIAFLLKLFLNIILSVFGVVVQLIGFFSVGILIVDKLRDLLDFSDYAHKVAESAKSYRDEQKPD